MFGANGEASLYANCLPNTAVLIVRDERGISSGKHASTLGAGVTIANKNNGLVDDIMV